MYINDLDNFRVTTHNAMNKRIIYRMYKVRADTGAIFERSPLTSCSVVDIAAHPSSTCNRFLTMPTTSFCGSSFDDSDVKKALARGAKRQERGNNMGGISSHSFPISCRSAEIAQEPAFRLSRAKSSMCNAIRGVGYVLLTCFL